eukprot:TRINITY_DN1242_c0_g1_i1.p1 TRINITY_DN1242_c0_g1~~TRINITY_DN1242_c0_g1_i1.p1  ORF type:complete len:346 (-),score=86.74 TRINITY_DN1242_c0_g1_i1:38-955(-)
MRQSYRESDPVLHQLIDECIKQTEEMQMKKEKKSKKRTTKVLAKVDEIHPIRTQPKRTRKSKNSAPIGLGCLAEKPVERSADPSGFELSPPAKMLQKGGGDSARYFQGFGGKYFRFQCSSDTEARVSLDGVVTFRNEKEVDIGEKFLKAVQRSDGTFVIINKADLPNSRNFIWAKFPIESVRSNGKTERLILEVGPFMVTRRGTKVKTSEDQAEIVVLSDLTKKSANSHARLNDDDQDNMDTYESHKGMVTLWDQKGRNCGEYEGDSIDIDLESSNKKRRVLPSLIDENPSVDELIQFSNDLLEK